MSTRLAGVLLLCWLSTAAAAAPIDDDPALPSSQQLLERTTAPPEPADPPSSAEESPQPRSDYLQAAQLAFQAGDIDACLEQLRAAVAHAPHLPSPGMSLALFYQLASEHEQARAALESIVPTERDQPDIYVAFGQMAMREGRWADAALHYEKALALEPPETWPASRRRQLQAISYAGLASIAEQRSDWPSAAQFAQKLVELDPQNAGFRHKWAHALFQAGHWQKAFEQFDIGYRQDPALTPPELAMGILYIRQRNQEQANRWVEAGVEKDQESAEACLQISVALLAQGALPEASTYADKAAELGAAPDRINMVRGHLARQRGELDEAQRQFRAVWDAHPGDHEAGVQLALALIDQPHKAQQLKALEIALQVHQSSPASNRAVAALGWVRYQLGNKPEGESLLKKAAHDVRAHPDSLYCYGRLLQDQQRDAEAARLATRLADMLASSNDVVAYRSHMQQWINEARAAARSRFLKSVSAATRPEVGGDPANQPPVAEGKHRASP